MLCCTGKYLFPLLTHVAVEKEVCPRGPRLVSRLQPPAVAMLSERQNWNLPPPALPASFQQEPFTHYKAIHIKIWPLLYNGDCSASAEMLACWENVTDSVSQALETNTKSTT